MEKHKHNTDASVESIETNTLDTENTKKTSNTRKIIAGAAIIILICAGAFGIFSFIRSLDYMRPVKDICSIYNSRETAPAKIFRLIYSGADKKAYNSAYKIIANSDVYYQYIDSISTELETITVIMPRARKRHQDEVRHYR